MQITWNAHAVVLPQVIEILSEVFVENLGGADGEAISHPAVYGPVVEDFICNIQRQAQLIGTDGMFDLEAISVTSRPHA